MQVDIPKNVELLLEKSDVARCLGFDPTRKLTFGKSNSDSLSTNDLYNAIYVYTYFIYLRIFTQDCLRTNQTVIKESPAFVSKHLQRKPMAISSEMLSSPL